MSDRVGLLVEDVDAAGPAAAGGLQPGDLLVALGDAAAPLLSCVDLAAATKAAAAQGRPLVLQVVRGEDQRTVAIPPRES